MQRRLSFNTTIRLVAFYFVLTQVLTVLRATSIYNSAHISNYLRLFVSSIYIILFFFNYSLKRKDFTIIEMIFLLFPIVGLGLGYVNNQLGRDYFSDFFNAIAFVLIIVYYRQNPQSISKKELDYLAKWEFGGTLVSLLTYSIFPLLGYPIKSVGIVSNFLLFPLSYFLSYKNKWWIAVFVTIMFGGKRGVMISAIVLLCYFYVFDKRQSVRVIVAVVFAGTILCAGLYFTKSPENIALLPTSLQRVAYRFMRVNPFSDFVDLHSDGRLDEIEGAMNNFENTLINIFLGKGNGFVYNTFHDGALKIENNHNIHFTPLTFLTRYGIIYTLAFYADYLWILMKSTKKIRQMRNHQFMMCITLFLVGTFVDQFTVFLPYTDYQFMISFGIMNGILLNNFACEKEGIII